MPVVPSTWNGSASDDWNNPSNWTPTGVPGLGATIVIPATLAPGAVQPAILNNAHAVVSGNIVDNGVITLGSVGNDTDFIVDSSLTLSGTGSLTLSDNPQNRIYSQVAGSVLTNDAAIQGAGQIVSDGGNLSIVNASGAFIDASQTNNVLNINNITIANDGTVESTGAAGLLLASMTLNQTGGGVLEANGGPVNLGGNVDIVGGTIEDGASGGLIHSSGGGSLLDGTTAGAPVTIAKDATVQIDNNDNLSLAGSIVNQGTISLASVGNDTDLLIGSGASGGTVELAGDGTVQLSDNDSNRIYSNLASTTLDNVDDMIEGAGEIFGGNLGIINEASGVIDGSSATGGHDLRLTGIGITNKGLIEGTGSGGLEVDNMTLIQTGAGTLEANGGTVAIGGGVDIVGGALTSVSGGLLQSMSGGSQLDGATAGALTISSGTTLQIDNNDNLTLATNGASATIANEGVIALDSVGNDTDLIIGTGAGTTAGTLALSGGGSIELSDSAANRIYSETPLTTLDNIDNTIEGAGQISGRDLSIVNEAKGVIDATQLGNVLNINNITVTNDGLVDATGAAGLLLADMTLDQTGGGVLEADGGPVNIGAGVDIVGGTIEEGANGGLIHSSNAGSLLDGRTTGQPVTIATGATVQIDNNHSLSIAGEIINEGSIAAASVGNDTDLIVGSGSNGGEVTLTGGGELLLSDSGANRIYSSSTGTTLDNVDNTIEGAGQIFSNGGDLSFINESKGVIEASRTNNVLNINDITITNDGTVESTGAAGLLLASMTLNQTGGGVLQANAGPINIGANVDIVGGTIEEGASGGLVHSSGDGSLLDGTTADAPVTIAKGATVQIDNNDNLSLAGSIVNQGTISLASVGNDTDLLIGSGASGGTVELSGDGTVQLSDNNSNRIYSNLASTTLDNVDDTIEGAGQIYGGNLGIINEASGVIAASQTHNVLNIYNIGITNDGTIESTGAAGLLLAGMSLNQTGGGVLEANGGPIDIGSNVDIVGGAIEDGANGGLIHSSGGGSLLDGTTADAPVAIAKGATIQVDNNDNLSLAGSIVNAGVISLASVGNYTDLLIGSGASGGTVELTGGGTVQLSDNTSNRIYSKLVSTTLDNADDTIEGAGQIFGGNLGVTNEADGVVAATYAAGTLTVSNMSFDNLGVARAENGATLAFVNALANISADPNHGGGSVLTGGTYDVVDPTSGGASTIAISGGGADPITTLDATVDLSGATSNLTSNGVALETSLGAVATGGALSLYYGFNSGTQQVFKDTANPFTIQGDVSLIGAVLQAPSIAISGGTLYGAGEFDDATPENAEVSGSIANDGTIVSAGTETSAGQPTFLVNGAVSGIGDIDINGDSILELSAASGAGQTINFENNEAAGLAQLRIDTASIGPTGAFQSAILGFESGDAIDLANLAGETSYSYDGGELTVNFGAAVAKLDLSGLTSTTPFSFSSDGTNGTLITLGATVSLVDDTSNGKLVTSNPALEGTGTPGETIVLSQGGHTLGSTTVGASGAWNLTPTGLTDGSYTIVVQEETAAELVTSTASLSFTLEQDLGLEAALSVVVDGGSTTPIGQTGAGDVSVSVTGLKSDDNGTITFSDGVSADNQVLTIVNGVLSQSSVDLSLMNDGPITSQLSILDAANNSFTMAGNTVTLDQGLGEQTQLGLTVDGGSNPTIGDAGAASVSFAVAGLESLDTGTVTFKDVDGETVIVPISGDQTSYAADLASLANGPITSELAVTSGGGVAFTPVAGNVVTLDQAVGEQAALALDVDGGSTAPIGTASAASVAFTVAGLQPGDLGVVTFTDAGGHTVDVAVNGGKSAYSANLSTLADGSISASLQVQTDAGGNSFAPVAGNSVTLQQDLGEQASLSLTVDGGGTPAPIGPSLAPSVGFAIAGLQPGDTGTVTFTDVEGETVQVAVAYGQTNYTADLSSLADGAIVSSLAVNTDAAGNDFSPVAGNAVTLSQILVPTTIALGEFHVGATASTAIAVENGRSNPAEALDVSVGGVSGDAYANGAISKLASEETDSQDIVAGLQSNNAGTQSGAVTLDYSADGEIAGGDGRVPHPIGSSTVALSATFYNEGVATITAPSLIVHVGDTGALDLMVANTAPANGYSEALDAAVSGFGGGLTGASGSTALAAGVSDSTSVAADYDATQTGTISGFVTLALSSNGVGVDNLGVTDLATVQAPVEITVDNYATDFVSASSGELQFDGTNYTLDLGSVEEGASPISARIGISNGASGPADLLSGSLTLQSGSGFTTSGGGVFSDIGAGGELTPLSITLASTTLGTFSETFLIQASGSNASGYSGALPSRTLTVTATVLPSPDLVVSDITAPADALAGQEVPVTWTETNDGDGQASGQWDDNIYLSSDAAGDKPQLLGSFTFDGSLAPGASVARSEVVTIPQLLSGDEWLVVRTDADNSVDPTPGDNNHESVAATPTDVTIEPLPQLVVSSITPPTDAYSGTGVQVSWTVTNDGDAGTSASSWIDKVYLTQSPDIDSETLFDLTGDPLLATVPNVSYLAPGGSYTSSAVVTLPIGISGPYYIVVETDASDQVLEASRGTSNLTASSVFGVTLTPPPDLQVSNVVAPANAFSGQPALISWTVVNTGSGSTVETTWYDQVWMSLDGKLDSSSTNLGAVKHTGALAPDGSYTAGLEATLPVGVTGSATFFVVTDYLDQVYEGVSRANDTGETTTPTNLMLTPPPDLVATIKSTPATALAGNAVQITWQVANDGSTTTPNTSWTDKIYLSNSPTLDATATPLTGVAHFGALAVGQSYTATAMVDLPSGISGPYYLIVDANAGDQVFEADYANDVAAAPITLENEPPDLVVSSVTAPSQLEAGQQVQISWQVSNTGSGGTGWASWSDQIVLSASGVYGASDNIVLEDVQAPEGPNNPLAAGASYDQEATVDIPLTLPSGSYTLFVAADPDNSVYETSYADNVSAGQAVTVQQALADLRVTSVTPPTNATGGQDATVQWTVENEGDGDPDTAYWFDTVYLSTTPTLTGASISLGTVEHTSSLSPGSSYTASGTFALPSTLTAGQYYFVVQTDAQYDVVESTHNDNVTASSAVSIAAGPPPPPAPELAVSNLSVPADATSGQTITVAYTVTNEGGATSRGWNDAVYLSPNQALGSNADIYLGYVEDSSLAAGASESLSQSFTIPNGVSGPYQVFVVADQGNSLGQSSLAAATASAPVQVELPPVVDFSVSSVTASVEPDDKIAINYTVTNSSPSAEPGSWDDAFYLSTDGVWSPSDLLLGTVTHSGGVVGDASYTGYFMATIPGVVPGPYQVIVRTDILRESIGTNATGASAPVSITLPSLTEGVAATGALATYSIAQTDSRYYQITVAAGETLDFALKASTLWPTASVSYETETYSTLEAPLINNIYVRYGAIPTTNLFDAATVSQNAADPNLVIQDTEAGTYYVEVVGDATESLGLETITPTGPIFEAGSGSGGLGGGEETTSQPTEVLSNTESYSLTAAQIPFSITSIAPSLGSRAGSITLTLSGSDFSANDGAELVAADGSVLQATQVQFVNDTEIWATFDLQGEASGQYGVEVGDDAASTTLANSFSVDNGPAGALALALVLPSALRQGQSGAVTFQYVNIGDTDIVAPIVELTTSQATFDNSDGSSTGSGSITFLAASPNGPAGILQPGAVGTETFDYTPDADVVAHESINFEAYTLQPNTPLDLTALEQALEPANIDATDWSNIWANFASEVGATYGSANQALAAEATELSQIGQPAPTLGDLIKSLLAQAEGELVGGNIATATDLSSNPSSLGLEITRSYNASLVGRNADGLFGDGWASDFDGSASVDSSGDVFIDVAGNYHSFTLESGGAYLANAGDPATLSVVDGLYEFQDQGITATFNAAGRLASYANADGDATTFTYDAAGDLTQVADSATGETISFTSNAEGHITSATSSDGATATYGYDSTGDLLTSVITTAGTTTYSYDQAPGTPSNNALASVGFDGVQQAAFTYNSAGLVQSFAGADGERAESFTYAGPGEIVVTNAGGQQTQLYYDAAGQLSEYVDALGDATQIQYNASDEILDTATPSGAITKYGYNSSGQVTSVTDPTGGVTSYGYGGDGAYITSVATQLGATTSYAYDAAGDITGVTYQDGASQTYQYNAQGLLTSSTDQLGNTTTYSYNSAGEITAERFADGSSDTFTYDALGRLTSAGDDGAVTSYGYNSDDELISVTDPNGQTLGYTYNSEGEIASVTAPSGTVTKYAYNADAQITEITDGSGNLIDKYTYDNLGALVETQAGNGDTTTYTYDAAGRTTAVINREAGGQTISFDDYVYNADSQIVSDTSQNGVWTYGYNADGELTSANFASSSVSVANQAIAYTYDAAGNRISETINGVTTPYTVNAMNEVTAAGGVSYTYDADGDMTSSTDSSGTTTYTYDAENQLASASGPGGTFTYSYNALGNLVSETQNGVATDFVINPLAETLGDEALGSVAESYNPAGGAAATYAYGVGLAATTNASGQVSYYNTDIAGDVTGLTGAGGALDDSYFYSPFGAVTQLSGSAGNIFQYVGGYGVVSSDDGLDVMGARVYDPSLGRFTSPDPLGEAASPNLYVYANNAPINQVDPTGSNYVSTGISVSFGIAVGVAVQIDDAGNVYLAPSVGVGTPGAGVSVTASNGSAGGPGISVQGGFTSPAGIGETHQKNIGTDANGNPTYTDEAGATAGTPGPGASITASYGYQIGTIPNPKNDGPPPIPPNNNASDIETAFEQPGNIPDLPSHLGPLAFGHTQFITPHDPNSLVGPASFGPQNFVSATNLLAYTIDFENASTASGPAQTITITEQLDPNLDWNTFRLNGFGFDNLNYTVGNEAFYSETLDLSATKGYDVAVTAGVNVLTGLATWTFQTIDPATGQTPLDPTIGLLPVDDANNDGDGSVSYTIDAKSGVSNGSIVNAQATVVFDNQPPIDTPEVSDTLDTTTPTSAVQALPAQSSSASFEVSWSGSDTGGPGIDDYTIYVSQDGGAATAWLTDTTLTNALFTGQLGHIYSFSSQATDNAGNQEAEHTTPDTTIEVGAVTPTVSISISASALTLTQPTATVDFTFSEATIDFTLADVASTGGSLSNLTGSGTSYSATFTAASDIDISNAEISVTSGSWTDALGTAGEGGSSPAFSVDTLPPYVSVADYIADKTALDSGPAFFIQDSAADVAENLDALTGDADIESILVTDAGTPTLTLTIEQALNDQSTLAKITTPYKVALSDSAGDIEALTAAEAKTLETLGYTTLGAQGPVTLGATTATTLAADGLTIAGATTTVSDKAKALQGLTVAQIDSLATLGVGELVASDSDVSLSGAQKAALGSKGILLEQPFASGSVQVLAFYASGATHEVDDYGYQGEPFTTVETVYGANGAPASKTVLNGSTLYQQETWNADDSFDIHTYLAGSFLGVSYASYDNAYTASGFRDVETFYDASADVVATETFQINGGYLITLNGALSQIKTVNQDGSYDIKVFGAGTVAGLSYAFYDNGYTASNFRDRKTFYDASGDVVATETFQTNGNYDLRLYAAGTFEGSRYASYDNAYTASNVLDQKTYYDASDDVIGTESFQTNGDFDIRVYTAGTFDGVAYASFDNSYNASNFRYQETYYNAADDVVAKETFQTNGGYAITLNGALSQLKTVDADGTYDVVHFGLTGLTYFSYENLYSSANTWLALAKDNLDGSGALTLLGPGLTTSQAASALSVEVGPDTFTLDAHARESITATGETSETFDFASGFGQSSIAGFLAAGATHDSLNLQLSMFNASWFTGDTTAAQEAQSLLSHATGVNSTVITDSAGDALTLLSVTKTTLANNLADFRFF